MRKQRRTFSDHGRHAKGEGRGNEIRLPSNPTGIANHIEAVVLIGIKDGSQRMANTREPAAMSVDHALGFAG